MIFYIYKKFWLPFYLSYLRIYPNNVTGPHHRLLVLCPTFILIISFIWHQRPTNASTCLFLVLKSMKLGWICWISIVRCCLSLSTVKTFKAVKRVVSYCLILCHSWLVPFTLSAPIVSLFDDWAMSDHSLYHFYIYVIFFLVYWLVRQFVWSWDLAGPEPMNENNHLLLSVFSGLFLLPFHPHWLCV